MIGAYQFHVNAIFLGADRRMWNLSAGAEGYFTNYEFICSATQVAQAAYIRFLSGVLAQNGESEPFGIAHRIIGKRLGDLAQALGYEQDKDSGIEGWNIWGDKKKVVLYRRTERVRQPR